MNASRQKMMQDIPEADVVITNPTHIAIAVVYDQDRSQSPLVAKGAGKIAHGLRR